MSANYSFNDDLEKLISLFKKIKDNIAAEKYQGVDTGFVQNIDLMIRNYEAIKGNVPPDMLNAMGEPIHKLMTVLIENLQSEYGDILPKEDTNKSISLSDQATDTPVRQGEELLKEIARIDEWLKKTGITPDESDRLLDRRMEVMALIKQNHPDVYRTTQISD